MVARGSDDRQVTASFWAYRLDEHNSGWQIVTGTCAGRPFSFGRRGSKSCHGVRMAMDYSSATLGVGNWTIAVHGMPSCKDCLIAGPRHRLDISFTATGETSVIGPPHGIIGQSFATPGVARNGKIDIYPYSGEFTTSAQAEGAIEGTAAHYEVAGPHSTQFAFSRFDAPAKALGKKATNVVSASSVEAVPVTNPAQPL